MTVEGSFESLPPHIRRLVEERLEGRSSTPEVVYRDRIVYRDRESSSRDDYSYHN